MPRYVYFGSVSGFIYVWRTAQLRAHAHILITFIQESATADSVYIVRRDASVQALNSIFAVGHQSN